MSAIAIRIENAEQGRSSGIRKKGLGETAKAFVQMSFGDGAASLSQLSDLIVC